MDNLLQVKEFYERAKDLLKLRPAYKKIDFSGRKQGKKDSLSVQVWGKKDIKDFEKLSSNKRKDFLKKRFMKGSALFVILADNLSLAPEVMKEMKEKRIAVFRSNLSQKTCRGRVKRVLSHLSSDQVTISGELLQISGLGVLIVGESGLGKSESALELVSRGYRFVCDDAVQVKRENSGGLVGIAPTITRYFMEIRGLGIINIKEIFGTKAVLTRSTIDLVIMLEKGQQAKEVDRLGLKAPVDHEILGVKIPQINIPVAPGRNIATLIEIACKVHILREKGYRAPQDIIKRLDRALSVR